MRGDARHDPLLWLLTCRMAIMWCPVGVGPLTGPLPESRSRACRPAGDLEASGGWCGGGGLQVVVYQGDGARAFADCGGDPLN